MEPESRDLLQRFRVPLLALYVGLLLFAVSRPGPTPWTNKARWIEPGPGLKFAGISQLMSEGPIVSKTGELTLELWLVPGFRPQEGNQEIASFYETEQVRRPLVLGQFPRGFILRGREDNPGADPRDDQYIGINEVGVERPSQLKHLAVTVDSTGAALHVNGRRTELQLPKTVAIPGEPFGGHLLLASSNTGWRVWIGGMMGVSIYDRVLPNSELRNHALDLSTLYGETLEQDKALLALYRFQEGAGRQARSSVASGPDLYFPELMMRPTRRNLLTVHAFDPGGRNWLPVDVTLNILGLVPLGIIVAWKRGGRGVLLALAVGSVLSLSIELAQSQIPGRASSMIDIGSNTAGATLGALVAWMLCGWLRGRSTLR